MSAAFDELIDRQQMKINNQSESTKSVKRKGGPKTVAQKAKRIANYPRVNTI